MTHLLAFLLSSPLVSPASANDGEKPAKTRRLALSPLRLDTRISLRPETGPAPMLEGAIQVWRNPQFAVEGSVAVTGGRSLTLPGPFRSVGSVDVGVDLYRSLGEWLAVGPSLGVAYRIFRQQGLDLDSGLTPIAGARAHVTVLRARTWSLVISTKFQADLGRTDLVLETAEVRQLNPFEGQFGLRFNFGHGRLRTKGES